MESKTTRKRIGELTKEKNDNENMMAGLRAKIQRIINENEEIQEMQRKVNKLAEDNLKIDGMVGVLQEIAMISEEEEGASESSEPKKKK